MHSILHTATSTVAFVAVALLRSASAQVGDFIYADDFESTASCTGVAVPGVAIIISPADRTTTLATQNRFLVKLRSCGYSGSVDLSQSGAPVSWTTSFDPPTVALMPNEARTGLLQADLPSDGDAGMFTLSVHAQASTSTASSNALLTVMNQVIIPFASDGTGVGDHHFPSVLVIKVGTMIRFVNQDSTSVHEVHAAQANDGFPHQTGTMAQGEEFDVTPNSPGTYDYYCHAHLPEAGSGAIVVQ